MPKFIIIIGTLSALGFILAGNLGPLMDWAQQWRFLIYLFAVYFLFLYFILVLSIVRNYQIDKQRGKKTVHHAFMWSLGVLSMALFFSSPV